MTSSQIKTNLSSYKQTFVSIARIFEGVFCFFWRTNTTRQLLKIHQVTKQ